MKKLVKQIRKKVEYDWGKKCKDFGFGCCVCWAHRVLEDLEEMAENSSVIEKMYKTKKNKKI